MNNTKINLYKKVLQELCEKFNGAEGCIKERIEELCSENKLSVEEVIYLFMNDYNNIKGETSCVLLNLTNIILSVALLL